MNRQTQDYAGEGIDDVLPIHAAVILSAALYHLENQSTLPNIPIMVYPFKVGAFPAPR
jgi:hypothetical protein